MSSEIESLRASAEAAEAEVERLRGRADRALSDRVAMERLAHERLVRAEAAEARLRAVEALADELDDFALNGEVSSGIAMGWRRGVQIAAHNLRAVVASAPSGGVAPTEQAGEGTRGGQVILCGPGKDEPDYRGVNSPTGRCQEHGDYLYFCPECNEQTKSSASPAAEAGE